MLIDWLWQCLGIYISMFVFVYCIPLHCCDTTPHSRTGISINLTWKAASLCLFMRVPPEYTQFQISMIATGDINCHPELCVSFTLEPSAWTEHPWTTAVTTWEKRPVAPAANWSASSRTNWYKEILVTIRTEGMLPLILGRLILRFLHLVTEPVYRGHSQDDWLSHAQAGAVFYH